MGRPLNRRELRAAAEAAEARGLTQGAERKPRRPPSERQESTTRRGAPAPTRTRIVWAVCDVGGRTVATFDYPRKSDAEALAVQLKSKGKGEHFVRSVKEPM